MMKSCYLNVNKSEIEYVSGTSETDRPETSGKAQRDPLRATIHVKGFTNRRQIFTTRVDRKLFGRCLVLSSSQLYSPKPVSRFSTSRRDLSRRSHIDEIYVPSRPILRIRPH